MNAPPIIASIAKAFPAEPIPPSEAVLYEEAYQGESELEEIKAFFGGRPWNTISPENIFRFRHALPLFSNRAFTYYAAAWMTCGILNPEAVDTGCEDLLTNLARKDVGIWNKEQRRAICLWLNYCKPDWPKGIKERYEEAARKFGCEF